MISLIRKKAQNALRNIALKRHLVKNEDVVCSRARRRDFRILGVIWSLESDDGFLFGTLVTLLCDVSKTS